MKRTCNNLNILTVIGFLGGFLMLVIISFFSLQILETYRHVILNYHIISLKFCYFVFLKIMYLDEYETHDDVILSNFRVIACPTFNDLGLC